MIADTPENYKMMELPFGFVYCRFPHGNFWATRTAFAHRAKMLCSRIRVVIVTSLTRVIPRHALLRQ